MTRVQVRKISNPSGVRKKVTAKRKNLSPKQVRYFGTKRQKAALARKKVSNKTSRPRAKRSTNPAWLVTLGPVAGVNPKKRRNTVPATKKAKQRKKVAANRKRTRRAVASNPRRKKKNAVRTRTRTVVKYKYRKSNPKVVVRYRSKKRNSRRGKTVRKRNPDIFGAQLGSKDSLKMLGGGVVGVAVVKIIPTLLPAGTIASIASSSFGKIAVAAVTATVAGWGAGKLDKRFGEGVMFGGWMMVTAVIINTVAPSLYSQYIGMGDFVPGKFVVPQNPVRAALPSAAPAMPAASGAAMKTSRLGSAYQPAY